MSSHSRNPLPGAGICEPRARMEGRCRPSRARVIGMLTVAGRAACRPAMRPKRPSSPGRESRGRSDFRWIVGLGRASSSLRPHVRGEQPGSRGRHSGGVGPECDDAHPDQGHPRTDQVPPVRVGGGPGRRVDSGARAGPGLGGATITARSRQAGPEPPPGAPSGGSGRPRGRPRRHPCDASGASTRVAIVQPVARKQVGARRRPVRAPRADPSGIRDGGQRA